MNGREEPVPFLWQEDPRGDVFSPASTKRRRRAKKKEYLGWASKPLVEFLQSVDKYSDEAIPQYDVSSIILQYVKEKNLNHPQKRKKILCDDKLLSLFGRKSINQNKISSLLETHYAENEDESDSEGYTEEKGENSNKNRQPKISSSDRITYQKKMTVEVPKDSLAAINPDNLKIVYLKRSLVQNLLKQPEDFERKVVGSYVRLKADPYDYFQRNSHQLQLVKGLKRIPNDGDSAAEILLQVSGMTNALSISALSDDNFHEDELKDLQRRMKNGMLKQPTVGELEGKAQILHEDITKHSITREIAVLKSRIDLANEKGYRREMSEMLERRSLLQTPAEQTRLLLMVPTVTAEEIKEDPPAEAPSSGPKCAGGDSTSSMEWEAVCVSPNIGMLATSLESKEPTRQSNGSVSFGQNGNDYEKARSETENNGLLSLSSEDPKYFQNPRMDSWGSVLSQSPSVDDPGVQISRMEPESSSVLQSTFQTTIGTQKAMVETEAPCEPVPDPPKVTGNTKQAEVIELSDDDEEDEKPSGGQQIHAFHPGEPIWHYLDPQGKEQGPFSMNMLKRWMDAQYFDREFKVWQDGQSPKDAALLIDILEQIP